MTVDQLATVLTNEVSFCTTWLIILTVIWVLSIGGILYKLYKQSNTIDDLTYIIDRIDRDMRKRNRNRNRNRSK